MTVFQEHPGHSRIRAWHGKLRISTEWYISSLGIHWKFRVTVAYQLVVEEGGGIWKSLSSRDLLDILSVKNLWDPHGTMTARQ